jgi:cell wall-associated NlpC family hydrolase
LTGHRLRWALRCVAALSSICFVASCEAKTWITIGPNDSLDSLARKYHVSIKDIAHANCITTNALLINGKKLLIPDPPKQVIKPAKMDVPGAILGNRIIVHMGPNEKYRLLTLVDFGTPLTVTNRKGAWFQVRLRNGTTGWVLGKYVTCGTPEHIAKALEFFPPQKPEQIVRHARDDRHIKIALHRSKRHVRVAERHSEHRRYAMAVSWRFLKHRPSDNAHTSSHRGVIGLALACRGIPYRWAGTSRSGFDCSGFTRYVFRKKGIDLPHNAAEQFEEGKRVKRSNIKPGDLVFFHTCGRGVSHVGIYIGHGKFVHASSGGGEVRVDTLRSGYYHNRLVGVRSVK